jgi:hypothetical protein
VGTKPVRTTRCHRYFTPLFRICSAILRRCCIIIWLMGTLAKPRQELLRLTRRIPSSPELTSSLLILWVMHGVRDRKPFPSLHKGCLRRAAMTVAKRSRDLKHAFVLGSTGTSTHASPYSAPKRLCALMTTSTSTSTEAAAVDSRRGSVSRTFPPTPLHNDIPNDSPFLRSRLASLINMRPR